jgi:hypothetical protein
VGCAKAKAAIGYGIDKNLADRARKTGAMPEADRTLAA